MEWLQQVQKIELINRDWFETLHAAWNPLHPPPPPPPKKKKKIVQLWQYLAIKLLYIFQFHN